MVYKSKRYKQRHRTIKVYTCKKHWKLDKIMSSFNAIETIALNSDDDNIYSLLVNMVIMKLKPLLPFMIRLYEYKLLPNERDYRSGFDTYGYLDNETIIYRLEYISDRWSVAFRLRWLINLVNKNYTFKGKELTYNYDKIYCGKYSWNYDLTKAPIGKFVLVEQKDKFGFTIAKKRRDGTFVTKDKTTKNKIVLDDVNRFQLFKHEPKSYYDGWYFFR